MKKIKNTGFSFGCLLLMTLLVNVHFVQAEKKDPTPSSKSQSVSGNSNSKTTTNKSGNSVSRVTTTTVGKTTTTNIQGVNLATGKTYNQTSVTNESGGGTTVTKKTTNVTPTITPTTPAFGYFEAVYPSTCHVAGYAFDPDDPAVYTGVKIYRDGPAGTGTYVMNCATGIYRPDISAQQGFQVSPGFDCALPTSYKGTGAHIIYVHAIDNNGTPNNQLTNNGKSIECAPLPSCNLIASATKVASGSSVNLSWTSANTVGTAILGISSGNNSPASWTVDPRDTTAVKTITVSTTTRYTLIISGENKTSAACERLIEVLSTATTATTTPTSTTTPDFIVTKLDISQKCSIDEMTYNDTCLKTKIKFNIENIGDGSANKVPYRVEILSSNGLWTAITTGTYSGIIGSGGKAPLVVSISPIPVGNSKIRVIVNPSGGLGEKMTSNNTSNPPFNISYEKARVDLSFYNLGVTSQCAVSEIQSGLCPSTKISFKIQNDGNKTIQSGTIIPYVIQVYQDGTWANIVQKLSYTYSVALAPGNKTDDISETIVNLPLDTTRIRARVNLSDDGVTARSSNYREDVLANNTSEILPALTYLYDVAKVELKLDSSVIRYGFATKLEWTVDTQYALTCTLSGPLQSGQTFPVTPGVNKGIASSLVLKSAQAFTITCTPVAGLGVPSDEVKKTVRVEVVPQVQEI